MEKKFNHLTAPTKYSSLLRNVPYTFNDDLTALEFCQTVYKYLIETNKATNEFIDYLNKFIKDFDVKLYDTVYKVLSEWADDGFFSELFSKAVLKDVYNYIDSGDIKLKNYIDNLILNNNQVGIVGVYPTLNALKEAHPNGKDGFFIVESDGYLYIYTNKEWTRTVKLLNDFWNMVSVKGFANYIDENEPLDLLDLKGTRYYRTYVNTNEKSPEFKPYQKNFPSGLEGMIEIQITQLDDVRRNFRLVLNATGTTKDEYTASVKNDGVLGSWKRTYKMEMDGTLQEARLTYETGSSIRFNEFNGTPKNELVDPIELPFGNYQGTIIKGVALNMPHDISTGTYLMNKNKLSVASDRERYTIYSTQMPIHWVGVQYNNSISWTKIGLNLDSYYKEIDEWVYNLDETRIVTDDVFTFITATDTHVEQESTTILKTSVAVDSISKFEYFCSHYKDVSFRAHLGDWIDGWQEKKKAFSDVKKITDPFFNNSILSMGLVGNHDFNSVFPREQIPRNRNWVEDYFSNKQVNQYFNKTNSDKTVYLEKMYYTDFEDKKIRVICLNSWDNPMTAKSDKSINIIPLIDSSYTSAQFNEYAETLLNTPDDYKIIILNHDVFKGVYNNGNSYKQINHDPMRELTTSFQNSTKGHYVQSGIALDDIDFKHFKIDSDYDFTGKPKNRIIAHICGHYHKDLYAEIGGVNYIASLCSLTLGTGVFSTIKDTAFDLVDVNLKTGTIKMNRIGNGETRNFNFKV